jgi:hypothetical protein
MTSSHSSSALGRSEPAELVPDPRRVVASLGNEARRRVFAAAVLGTTIDLPPRKLEKALEELRDAGLLDSEGHVIESAFVIVEHERDPLHPFVVDGRIDHYPVKWERTVEILRWIATTLPHRNLTERDINEHLAHRTTDVALLRRHLVDAGFVSRTADGGVYRVVD